MKRLIIAALCVSVPMSAQSMRELQKYEQATMQRINNLTLTADKTLSDTRLVTDIQQFFSRQIDPKFFNAEVLARVADANTSSAQAAAEAKKVKNFFFTLDIGGASENFWRPGRIIAYNILTAALKKIVELKTADERGS